MLLEQQRTGMIVFRELQKLKYLNSKLTRELKNKISCIILSNDNYDNYQFAITLRKERFWDIQTVINAHFKEHQFYNTNNPESL